MSATRDKNQKFTFLYSNLYQIYKKDKERETPPAPPDFSFQTHSRVLKAEDLHKVVEFKPMELLRPKTQSTVPVPSPVSDPVQNLKKNLQDLSELHSRLKFMLQELEELIKE